MKTTTAALRREAINSILGFNEEKISPKFIVDSIIIPLLDVHIKSALIFETFSNYLSDEENVKIAKKLIKQLKSVMKIEDTMNTKGRITLLREIVNDVGIKNIINFTTKMLDAWYDVKFKQAVSRTIVNKVTKNIEDKNAARAAKDLLDTLISKYSEDAKPELAKFSHEITTNLKQALKFIIRYTVKNKLTDRDKNKLKSIREELNKIKQMKTNNNIESEYLASLTPIFDRMISTIIIDNEKADINLNKYAASSLIAFILAIAIKELNSYFTYSKIFANIKNYIKDNVDENKAVNIMRIILEKYYSHKDILHIRKQVEKNPLLINNFASITGFVNIISNYAIPTENNINEFEGIKIDTFLEIPNILAELVIKSIDNVIPAGIIYKIAKFICEATKFKIEDYNKIKPLLRVISTKDVNPFVFYKTAQYIVGDDNLLKEILALANSKDVNELFNVEAFKSYIALLKMIEDVSKLESIIPVIENDYEFNMIKVLRDLYDYAVKDNNNNEENKENIVDEFLKSQRETIRQAFEDYNSDKENKEKLINLLKTFAIHVASMVSVSYIFSMNFKPMANLHNIITDEVKNYKDTIKTLSKSMENKPYENEEIEKLIANYVDKAKAVSINPLSTDDYVKLITEITSDENKRREYAKYLVQATLDLVTINLNLEEVRYKLQSNDVLVMLAALPALLFMQKEFVEHIEQIVPKEATESIQSLDAITKEFDDDTIKWYNIYAAIDINLLTEVITASSLVVTENGYMIVNQIFKSLRISPTNEDRELAVSIFREAVAIVKDIIKWYGKYWLTKLPDVINSAKEHTVFATYANAMDAWFNVVSYASDWDVEKYSRLIDEKLILKLVPFTGIKAGAIAKKIKAELLGENKE